MRLPEAAPRLGFVVGLAAERKLLRAAVPADTLVSARGADEAHQAATQGLAEGLFLGTDQQLHVLAALRDLGERLRFGVCFSSLPRCRSLRGGRR